MKRYSIGFLLILLTVGVLNAGRADVPYLSGRVNDYANILSDSMRTHLGELLKEHEAKTTNQVVLLTIQSLEGESIEDYSNKVFNEWALGQKDKDNGILMVVVPGERRMRIEVGYGLEGTLPDILAGRIIQNIMTPAFREGDFDGGIYRGLGAVLAVLEGEDPGNTPELTDAYGVSESTGFSGLEGPDLSIGARILMGAFIFGIIGLFTLIGIMTPGFGWFMYLFLIPFWAMFPVVVLGTRGALVCFILYLVIYPASKLYLKRTEWYKKAKEDLKNKGKASIGGFTFTSGGSGGSWSSGGSSGGFSGGGGSSGGGGASGSW
ncbi:MAG: YgcG family protein [Bacteroidales bacterium]